MHRSHLRRAATAMMATAVVATGGLTAGASSAFAAAPHPAVGTTVTSTAFGDRVTTTYEKTGVLRVFTGPNLPSTAELAALAGIRPGSVIPNTFTHCGGGSQTHTCLTINGSGLAVNFATASGTNDTVGTLNMNERLYFPPPSAFHEIQESGYGPVAPGNSRTTMWIPQRNEPGGTYTAATWIGAEGVNSLAQGNVVP
jgi:hypothetical protein